MTKDERREYHREWRKKHPEYYRLIYTKKREYHSQYAKAWRRENPDYRKKRFEAHPEEYEKHVAREKFGIAVRKGLIKRLPCERCKSTTVEGHHPDYSRPLEVRWLCRPHHRELHWRLV